MNKIICTCCFVCLHFLTIGQCDTASIYTITDANAVCFDTTFSKVRNCYSNNYPDHDDSYNSPFTVTASDEEYSMCLYPDTASNFTPLYEETETPFGCNYTYQFGVAINGIGYTPNSNEYFDIIDSSTGLETGEVNIEWHKEARYMFNANFGNNGGHINSFGSYHYHDVPVDYFTDSLGITIAGHSTIVGYAADGFPIYYKFVYSDANDTSSSIVALSSGYSLIPGTRPGDGFSAPDGAYSGLYYEDYEYTTTTLDSCNGRWGKTPDFPNGTYYYVLTDNYPYIPRCFKGTVLDNTFRSLANCPASTASTDCSDAPVEGCTDPFSCNYDPDAEVDDGSCDYNYDYQDLTISMCVSYTAPSGKVYNSNGNFLDTLIIVGDCDTIYDIDLTLTSGAISTRNLTHPSSGSSADGEILFGPPTGTPPYSFSVDSGLTYSTSLPPLFTGLTIGDYSTIIKDGNDCEMLEVVSLSALLPIELIYFKALAFSNTIKLSWSTATETNNLGFEIQHSPNSLDWEKIGFVDGIGSSTQTNTYRYEDIAPHFGLNYYRLRQIDLDGASVNLPITSAEMRNNKVDKIFIFPNPVNQILHINNAEGLAKIVNFSGRIILETKITSTKSQSIDVSNLEQGVYHLIITNAEGEQVIKRFAK